MIRLVASDIDGTLLHGEETTIAPVIFCQIRRLRAKGILFCPASGRQYSSLRRLFSPVANQLTYLCENGAVVYGAGSPGPVLGKTPMSRRQALALCEEILALPSCEVLISGANTSYLCPKQADIVDHMRYFVGNNVTILATPDEMPEPIVKLAVYAPAGAETERFSSVPVKKDRAAFSPGKNSRHQPATRSAAAWSRVSRRATPRL